MMPRTALAAASWSAHEALAEGRKQLALQSIDSAFLDARILLEAATGLTREHILLKDFALSDNEQQRYFTMIDRRAQHEPVAKIIGIKSFWKHDFYTSSATLDPRPETELMVEAVLANCTHDRPLRILDLGTGTGCILISLLADLPHATGVGIDQSIHALEIAARNAEHVQVESRTTFLPSNWFEKVEGTFDVIVSNPPYIEEEAVLPPEVRYDPEAALFAGQDGLDAYRAILKDAFARLNPEGLLVLEIGAGQANAIIDLAQNHTLTLYEIRKDLAQIPRTLVFKRKS
ncbi:MAG: peptide chain release factor N(5)-glutamine methyltransferase [Rickettsiales bacterium]